MIPKHLLPKLGITEIQKTQEQVLEFNGQQAQVVGILRDLPVDLGKVTVKQDFYIIEGTKDDVVIFGNVFLATT